jgi:hypothetical protein
MTWTFQDVMQLQEYENAGLKLRVEGDVLHASPRERIDPEMLKWLKDRKPMVMELLRYRAEIPW